MLLISIIFALLICLHVAFTWIRSVRNGRLARLNTINSHNKTCFKGSTTILIPAWNESMTIKQCIESLLNQTYRDWKAIISAGGQDGTYNIAMELSSQDSRLNVIEQLPKGKNAALAEALEIADGEVIVILDADSVVEPSWLSSLLGRLDCGFSAVCGNYYPIRDTWVSRSEQMEKISSYLIHRKAILQGSGSIAVHRKILMQSGGFPANITVGVDWDMDARLKKQGLTVGFAKEAKVSTQRPATLKEYWRNELRWRRAHLASTWRYRRYFLENPRIGLQPVSFYLIALAAATALIVFLFGMLFWSLTGLFLPSVTAILFFFWIIGRRAALAVEVAVYSDNWRLLKYAWAPIVLLFVAFAASLSILITPGKAPVIFQQGPRQVPFSLKNQTASTRRSHEEGG